MLLGRFVFQQQVLEMSRRYPLFRALNKAIEERGLVLMIVLRVCPVVPFTPINFFFGATNIKVSTYALGLLGVLPSTLGHVFLGTTLSDIEDAISGETNWKDNFWLLFSVIFGTVAAISAIIWVSVATNKYLKDIIREQL